MTLDKPYKIYISWSGYYPTTPSYGTDGLPIITNEVYTELNIYDNKLTLSRERSAVLFSMVERKTLSGSFSVRGDDYDSLKTASATLNELILVLKIKNDSDVYVEQWRGLMDIRGYFNENSNVITLSKFNTIDDYTDILQNLDNKWSIYDNRETTLPIWSDGVPSDFILYNMHRILDISLGLETAQYSKRITSDLNYNEIFGALGYDDTQETLIIGSVLNSRASATLVEPSIEIDITFILKTLRELFHIVTDLVTVDIGGVDYNQLTCYKIKDFVFPSISNEIDLSNIAINEYSYEDQSLIKKQKYTINQAVGAGYYSPLWRSQDVTYNVSSDAMELFSYDKLSELRLDWGLPLSTLEDIYSKDDYFLLIAERSVSAYYGVKKGTITIPGSGAFTAAGYKTSLTNMLQNEKRNFAPLDKAYWGGTEYAMNPDVAKYSLKLKEFSISSSDGFDFKFSDKYKTEIFENLKINKIEHDLFTNKCKIILEK